MSTTSLIRKAKTLNLNGAQPGASATVAKVIKTLEEERTLRLALQREHGGVRAITVQMEETVAELREAAADAREGEVADALEQQAVTLERYISALRAAITPREVEA